MEVDLVLHVKLKYVIIYRVFCLEKHDYDTLFLEHPEYTRI